MRNAGKYNIEVEFSDIESDSEVTVSPFNSKAGADIVRTYRVFQSLRSCSYLSSRDYCKIR